MPTLTSTPVSCARQQSSPVPATEQSVRALLADVHPDLAADVLEFLSPEWDADSVALVDGAVVLQFGPVAIHYRHQPGADLLLAEALAPVRQREAA